MVVVAALAQRRILGSGIIADPNTGPAVGTGGGALTETVRAQGLSVKVSAFRYGMNCSAVGAGKGVVHGIPPIVCFFGSKETAASPHGEAAIQVAIRFSLCPSILEPAVR